MRGPIGETSVQPHLPISISIFFSCKVLQFLLTKQFLLSKLVDNRENCDNSDFKDWIIPHSNQRDLTVLIGEGNSDPFQYSCLENPMDRGAWRATVHKDSLTTEETQHARKIAADGDCSHEIKRCQLLGRKAMTNLESVLKSRHMTLPIKVCIIKAMVFPLVMQDVRVRP